MKRMFSLIVPLLMAGAAGAAPIGNAVAVKPDASLETLAGTVALSAGGSVEANNRVLTGPAGSTRLRFLDASTLDVGAGAAVTLDDFVYTGGKADKASLTMTKGAFRWVTGHSEKKNYDLKTPLASIGIRGTDFTVDTDEALTTIRLNSGAVNACSRVSQSCALITRRGQGVRLFADGRIETFEDNQQAAPPVIRRAAAPPPAPPTQMRPARSPQPRLDAPPPRRIAYEPRPRRVAAYDPPRRMPPRPVYDPGYDPGYDDGGYMPPPRRDPPAVIVDPYRPRPPRPSGCIPGAQNFMACGGRPRPPTQACGYTMVQRPGGGCYRPGPRGGLDMPRPQRYPGLFGDRRPQFNYGMR